MDLLMHKCRDGKIRHPPFQSNSKIKYLISITILYKTTNLYRTLILYFVLI